MIESAEYAPKYLRDCVADHHPELTPVVYLMERQYRDIDATRFPSLRDRRSEYTKMLRGFVPDGAPIYTMVFTGAELREYGYEPVGAQFSQEFIVMWA